MNRQQALNLLGLTKNSDAEEIKKAYRRKAMQFHPDKNKGTKQSEERFKEVSEAYQTLINPNSSISSDAFSNFRGFDDRDIFDAFIKNIFNVNFGTERHKPKKIPGAEPKKLQDADLGLFNISFSQAVLRESITIKVQAYVVCTTCHGDVSFWKPCAKCKQYGVIRQQTRTPHGRVVGSTRKCGRCGGLGWERVKRCKVCNNSLIYTRGKQVVFKLPTNFRLGQRICLSNQGNESWKAPNGSIHLMPNINIPDLSNLPTDQLKQLKEIIKNSK